MATESLVRRLHEAQMQDVSDMHKIYDAAHNGDTPAIACERVITGYTFNLSQDVAEGILERLREG